MAKKIYDNIRSVDPPTLLLKKRDFSNIGAITASGLSYKNNFNAANELSFQVYKFVDEALNALWDEINDYNIIYLPEYQEYFDMQVSLSEDTGIYKTVVCTSLAESELSQTKLYDIEINTEDDMARDDYDEAYPTLFYREVDEKYADYPTDSAEYKEYKKLKNASLLHRILSKASNYSIGSIDDSLKNMQTWYPFRISDTNIYDELTGEIAEQYLCLFTFDIRPDGTRLVNAHDLCNTCSDCGYRGDFHDKCPECGGTSFGGAYGTDTTILVSKDNLASSASLESNKDELKNCFRVSGGDDLITATVANCNPNGSNYFFHFSKEMLDSMPTALKEKIENYNAIYDNYLTEKVFDLNTSHVAAYQTVRAYIDEVFGEGPKDEQASQITGYNGINTLLYELIDLKLYLESSMMPTSSIDGQTIDDALSYLTASNLSPIAVSDSSQSANSVVNRAITDLAKVYVNTARFKISIKDGDYTYQKADTKDGNGKWRGKITLTGIEDNTCKTTPELEIDVNSDAETYLKQKLDRILASSDSSVRDIASMKLSFEDFCKKIKCYSINYLINTKASYDDCISFIISENGSDLYAMKKDYQERSRKLDEQISYLTSLYQHVDTLYSDLVAIQEQAKKDLDFESYLGKSLWRIFCSYRREDSYQNSNYISEGLNSSELIALTNDLITAAKRELYKASTMQYSVRASLYNLLALKEFQPIVDKFECGNWIHMMVDDTLYHLRLLSYEINFDDLTILPVEFSTVEQIWSGASDVESILNSASSIAGSYSATLSQVSHSAKASSFVDNWVKKGLDATAAKIVNNAANQDIVIDKTGILCRRYDDLEDSYENCQAKIINNCIAITDDGWKSVKTALGKYVYPDPKNNYKETTAYGLLADTLVGSLILGETLGIYNSEGSLEFTKDGLHVSNGTNTVAINPNDTDGLFQITVDDTPVFCTNSDGNLDITGNIHAIGGEFNGDIVSSATIKGGIIDGADIVGGTISINHGNFTIDKNGNMQSKGNMSLGNGAFSYNETNGLEIKGALKSNNGIYLEQITSSGTAYKKIIWYDNGAGEDISTLCFGERPYPNWFFGLTTFADGIHASNLIADNANFKKISINSNPVTNWSLYGSGKTYRVGMSGNCDYFRPYVYDDSSAACNGAVNLGSANHKWKNLYLSGDIHVDGDVICGMTSFTELRSMVFFLSEEIARLSSLVDELLSK